MRFRVAGLDPAPFVDLFALDDLALAEKGVRRVMVEDHPGAPCRITLDDVAIGEPVLLLNYMHQTATTPYRQQGPIFVSAEPARAYIDEMPPALKRRTLSMRAFDEDGMMVDAELIAGESAADVARRMFGNDAVAYIHAHYATRGCFAATIERA